MERSGLSVKREIGFGYFGSISKGIAAGLPQQTSSNTEVTVAFLTELEDGGKV